MDISALREQLFAMQDNGYRLFTAKLIPNIDPGLIIGVRAPELRKFAREFARTPGASEFLHALPHKYFEENNLHAFLTERLNDFDLTVAALEEFLPYVDNWATCDSMRPKILARHKQQLLPKIYAWIKSDRTYTVRYAVGLLMSFYIDGDFCTEFADAVAAIHSDEYYVNMMRAWYFATALAKHYDTVLPYIENGIPDTWTHNKAIQKSVESRRITDEQKAYLRTLKKPLGSK